MPGCNTLFCPTFHPSNTHFHRLLSVSVRERMQGGGGGGGGGDEESSEPDDAGPDEL